MSKSQHGYKVLTYSRISPIWDLSYPDCSKDFVPSEIYITDYARSRGAVFYQKNEWVFPMPGCGPLGVFKERKHAEAWARYNWKPFSLMSCTPDNKVTEDQIKTRLAYFGVQVVPCLFDESFEELFYNNKLVIKSNPPEGTRFAYCVKCLA